MLRFIGWTYLIVGILAIMFVGFPWFMSGTIEDFAYGAAVVIAALLVPALLFALADLVQHTRETRDAVRALAGMPSIQAAQAWSNWGVAAVAENAARDSREQVGTVTAEGAGDAAHDEGVRARARRDAGSVADGSRGR